jgi:hypothetical protein
VPVGSGNLGLGDHPLNQNKKRLRTKMEEDLLLRDNFQRLLKVLLPEQQAVEDKIARIDRSRLARECAKLDPKYEQSLAEEGFAMEIDEWPKY